MKLQKRIKKAQSMNKKLADETTEVEEVFHDVIDAIADTMADTNNDVADVIYKFLESHGNLSKKTLDTSRKIADIVETVESNRAAKLQKKDNEVTTEHNKWRELSKKDNEVTTEHNKWR